MLIRPATVADVPFVLPMVRQLCDLHACRDPERFQVRADVIERYALWLPERAADARSVFLVAESPPGMGGPVEDPPWRAVHAAAASPRPLAGFLVGTIEPEVPIFWMPECGWVHDVWVEPAARGRGIARALVDAAAQRFTALGIKQMRLHTGTFNDAARATFVGAGFRPSVVEMLRSLD
ncbi:MAG: N-acetyltransferase family protein [Phycisphaerales bacterium]